MVAEAGGSVETQNVKEVLEKGGARSRFSSTTVYKIIRAHKRSY